MPQRKPEPITWEESPAKPEAAAPEDVARFPAIKLVTIDQYFGGWDEAQRKHFADGGVFDTILKSNR